MSKFLRRASQVAQELIGVLLIGVSATIGIFYTARSHRLSDQFIGSSSSDRAELRATVEAQARQLAELENVLTTLSGPEKHYNVPLERRFDVLQSQVQDLKAQNSEILKVLGGDDAIQKMAVPFLQRDISELKSDQRKEMTDFQDRYKTEVAALRDEEKSQQNLILWAIGLTGLANIFGGLFSRKKNE